MNVQEDLINLGSVFTPLGLNFEVVRKGEFASLRTHWYSKDEVQHVLYQHFWAARLCQQHLEEWNYGFEILDVWEPTLKSIISLDSQTIWLNFCHFDSSSRWEDKGHIVRTYSMSTCVKVIQGWVQIGKHLICNYRPRHLHQGWWYLATVRSPNLSYLNQLKFGYPELFSIGSAFCNILLRN